ncbi:MAG TPA: hypothetical protein VMV03_03055 [Spirochaetia bacterium]|nr:hypothetical protein [Spirochaetia bacterium]
MTQNNAESEPIGAFLVRIGAMQSWQLDDVLLAQKSGDSRMFGELAIALGYIDDSALRRYVESHPRGVQAVGA